MFPNMMCGACKSNNHKRNLKMNMKYLEPMSSRGFRYSNPFNMDQDNIFLGVVPDKPNKIFNKNGGGGIRKNMANKISNFSDLIQRVTASCLLQPLGSATNFVGDISDQYNLEKDYDQVNTYTTGEGNEDGQEEEYTDAATAATGEEQGGYRTRREMEMMMLIGEVFETVSYMKKAYFNLQEAHCPWDADKMRLSDVAVVTELRKLVVLGERFRRSCGGGIDDARRSRMVSGPTMREVVAPYEAALEKLKMEVKSKAAEVDNLREKLKTSANVKGGGGIKNRSHSRKSKSRVSCSSQFQAPSPSASPVSTALMEVPELFEACMSSVKEESRSFASVLFSLMISAHWDIAATVNSITATSTNPNSAVTDSIVGPTHAKYALESYVNRKIFQGFYHESFYMDERLSSLLNPDQFRSECFAQYSDMKSMDPMELLGILPSCQFGKFCSNKYLSIIHPKMEESLFGDLEQRRQVLAGSHPRSRFYGEFLAVAKAVWLLHLIAFALDPLPSHFEGSIGAEFHPEYMESAVRFPGGRVAGGHVVGFPVSPGFKLGNGYVVKARVYLVPKSEM